MKKLGLVMLCTIMLIGVYGCTSKNDSNNKKTESEKTVTKKESDKGQLSEVLPKPDAGSSKVGVNNDKTYLTYVYKASKDDFNNYIKKCKEKGFTIEKVENSWNYIAFNKDGYKVYLHYYEVDNRYNIELSAPIVIKDFVWPKTDLVNKIPTPKSNKGSIEKNTDLELIANVGDTSYDDFKNYIAECRKKGFNESSGINNDQAFHARNKDGDELGVEYKGFQIMNIRFGVVVNLYNSGKK